MNNKSTIKKIKEIQICIRINNKPYVPIDSLLSIFQYTMNEFENTVPYYPFLGKGIEKNNFSNSEKTKTPPEVYAIPLENLSVFLYTIFSFMEGKEAKFHKSEVESIIYFFYLNVYGEYKAVIQIIREQEMLNKRLKEISNPLSTRKNHDTLQSVKRIIIYDEFKKIKQCLRFIQMFNKLEWNTKNKIYENPDSQGNVTPEYMEEMIDVFNQFESKINEFTLCQEQNILRK